jgi:hypothetical protein
MMRGWETGPALVAQWDNRIITVPLTEIRDYVAKTDMA